MSKSLVCGSIVAIGIALSPAHAESMRCGQSIVNESATVAQLLAQCGEPTNKESKTEDVIARNSNGSTRKIGTQITERWTYARPQLLPMVVTIVDGKVTRLERAE